MKARELFSGASYAPDQLRVIFEAFDQAWAAIAADIGDDPAAVEVARLRLANLILSLAHDGSLDNAERLKDAALRLLPSSRRR